MSRFTLYTLVTAKYICLRTVKNQMKWRIMRHFIRVYTVCHAQTIFSERNTSLFWNHNMWPLASYKRQVTIQKSEGKIHKRLILSLRPINNLSFILGRVFLGWTSIKLGLMCLAQGHNAVTPVRLESAAPRSRVKHSTTEPLSSISVYLGLNFTIFCSAIFEVNVSMFS